MNPRSRLLTIGLAVVIAAGLSSCTSPDAIDVDGASPSASADGSTAAPSGDASAPDAPSTPVLGTCEAFAPIDVVAGVLGVAPDSLVLATPTVTPDSLGCLFTSGEGGPTSAVVGVSPVTDEAETALTVPSDGFVPVPGVGERAMGSEQQQVGDAIGASLFAQAGDRLVYVAVPGGTVATAASLATAVIPTLPAG